PGMYAPRCDGRPGPTSRRNDTANASRMRPVFSYRACSIEVIIERAFEQAFQKALDQTLQTKAKELFKKTFQNGSPLAKKLEEKIEAGFEKFIEQGIRWEKKKPGFKK